MRIGDGVGTMGRLAGGLAAAWLVLAAVPAAAQVCIGDCDSNKQVTVEELVRGVNIALGSQAVATCPSFDRNSNAAVTIDELIAGVNSALQGCFPPVIFRGTCLLPGPSGLVPCSAGAPVRLSVCLDRSRCLFDSGARRILQSGVMGADGRFSLFVTDEALLDALLLIESDVAGGVGYRAFTFGPSSAGSVVEGLAIDPRSEAVVRLVNQYGLGLFDDLGISELIGIIRAALANLSFAGLTPGGAADLATSTAGDDDGVGTAIETRRFTPVPSATTTLTPTPSHTATVALTATPSRTSTITLTPTVTLTPTPTFSATATRTFTNTPTVTATFTATSTMTRTFTATATPTITLTPTVTATPTNTLPPLNLSIEVNPDPVRPGETLEVTFIVSNTGGSQLNGVELEVVLPVNIEPFSDNLTAGGGRCGLNQSNQCQPGGTLTWNLFSLSAGEVAVLRAPPIVAPGTPNGTELAIAATASATGLTKSETYTAVVQSGISFPYDLALSQDRKPVRPGELLTYTLSYGFRAVVGSADTRLRMPVPPGTTFVSASDDGALVGDEVEWSVGTLTPGDGGIRRVTVEVSDGAPIGGQIAAQAVISRADGSAGKRSNAVTHVQAAVPIGITLEANPDPARPGEALEVAIHLTNPSNTGTTVELVLVVPDQIDNLTDNATLGDGICGAFTLGNPCARRATVLWPINVPPRDGVTVMANPIVSMAAPAGAIIPLQAHIRGLRGIYTASARTALRVDGGSVWELWMDDDRDPVTPTEVFTYRLTARHRPSDPNPVDGLLRVALPDDVTVVDAGDAIVDGNLVEWDLGSLASNDVVVRELNVQVAQGAVAGSLLAAEAELRDAAAPLSASRQRIHTRVQLGSPLAASLLARPDPIRPGEVLQTEFTVHNTGSGNLNGTRIDIRVPENVETFPQSLTTGGSCSATNQCAPRDVVRFNTTTVPMGQSLSVLAPPRVAASTPPGTLLRLLTRVVDRGGAPTAGRDSLLTRTIIVDDAVPFDLALTESADPTLPGQTMDYTLHFGRVAATDAADAVLRLHLPPGVYFVGSDDGGMAVGEDLVEWDLGPLAAGSGGSRTVTVVVDALAEGSPLRALATLSDGDDPLTEKRAHAVTTVGTPGLIYAMSATPDPGAPGAPVTVSLSITNPRASRVNNITVEGAVPPESPGFLDNTTTGGGRCGAFTFNTCGPRTRVLWVVDVDPGATVTVTMPVPLQAALAPGSVVRFLGRFQENISTPPQFITTAVAVE